MGCAWAGMVYEHSWLFDCNYYSVLKVFDAVNDCNVIFERYKCGTYELLALSKFDVCFFSFGKCFTCTHGAQVPHKHNPGLILGCLCGEGHAQPLS